MANNRCQPQSVRMSFSEAKAKLSDHYSGLKLMSLVHHINLPPRFIQDIRTGIREQLNGYINVYNESMNGVLIAYKNVKAMQQTGAIIGDEPYIHFKVCADAIYFQPQIGAQLRGVVNKMGKDHVGCLVHASFNVSLKKPRTQMNLAIGDEVVFEILQATPHSGLLSINGRLEENELNGPNKRHNDDSIGDAPVNGKRRRIEQDVGALTLSNLTPTANCLDNDSSSNVHSPAARSTTKVKRKEKDAHISTKRSTR